MELLQNNFDKKLKIHVFPNPVLRKKTQSVTVFDDELKNLCQNMLKTMYLAPGIGLAAPQVGISSKIFVADVLYERERKYDEEGNVSYTYKNFSPHIFINPQIFCEGEEVITQEGCLSLPKIYEDVPRKESVHIKYQDPQGNFQELKATGLLSVCIQHEYDHLEGKIFLDYIGSLKRQILIKQLQKKR